MKYFMFSDLILSIMFPIALVDSSQAILALFIEIVEMALMRASAHKGNLKEPKKLILIVFTMKSKIDVQGSEIRYADSTKQVPIRARQNRQARAGTNFTKPRTSLFSELCRCCFQYHRPCFETKFSLLLCPGK